MPNINEEWDIFPLVFFHNFYPISYLINFGGTLYWYWFLNTTLALQVHIKIKLVFLFGNSIQISIDFFYLRSNLRKKKILFETKAKGWKEGTYLIRNKSILMVISLNFQFHLHNVPLIQDVFFVIGCIFELLQPNSDGYFFHLALLCIAEHNLNGSKIPGKLCHFIFNSSN